MARHTDKWGTDSSAEASRPGSLNRDNGCTGAAWASVPGYPYIVDGKGKGKGVSRFLSCMHFEGAAAPPRLLSRHQSSTVD
eukprot:3913227-Rhodomonas_salina.1